jgi:hypothetical protein
MFIPIYKPYLPICVKREAYYALQSGDVGYSGLYVDKVIDKLKDYYNSKYVLLVENDEIAQNMMDNCLVFSNCMKSYPSYKSFSNNNFLNIGKGGVFLTDSVDIYNFVRIYHKYGLTNIECALLYGQLEIIDNIKQEYKRVLDLYNQLISTINDLEVYIEECSLVVKIVNLNTSFEIIEHYFFTRNIEIKEKNGFIELPVYPDLTNNQVEHIVRTFKNCIETFS